MFPTVGTILPHSSLRCQSVPGKARRALAPSVFRGAASAQQPGSFRSQLTKQQHRVGRAGGRWSDTFGVPKLESLAPPCAGGTAHSPAGVLVVPALNTSQRGRLKRANQAVQGQSPHAHMQPAWHRSPTAFGALGYTGKLQGRASCRGPPQQLTPALAQAALMPKPTFHSSTAWHCCQPRPAAGRVGTTTFPAWVQRAGQWHRAPPA